MLPKTRVETIFILFYYFYSSIVLHVFVTSNNYFYVASTEGLR